MEILPKLHIELSTGTVEVDVLKEYFVEYSFKVQYEKCSGVTSLLKAFSLRAANDLALQRGREYNFGQTQTFNERATRLDKLSPTERKNLPTNNIRAERSLAVFDQFALRSARTPNKNFSGAGKIYFMYSFIFVVFLTCP